MRLHFRRSCFGLSCKSDVRLANKWMPRIEWLRLHETAVKKNSPYRVRTLRFRCGKKNAENTTHVPSQASFSSSSSSTSAGFAMLSCWIARFTGCLQPLNSGNPDLGFFSVQLWGRVCSFWFRSLWFCGCWFLCTLANSWRVELVEPLETVPSCSYPGAVSQSGLFW